VKPRFGISIIPSASGRSDPVGEAERAGALGWDLVTLWDHPHGEHPSFETWTLMTWIAAKTSGISIGSNVLGLPLRAPALTAKMAESLDRVSGGRLILGLGAGGNDTELAGYGAPVRTPRQKIEALEEALTIMRGVWSEPTFTFEGRYYQVSGTLLEPKPARPIPIWLGTYGSKGLDIAGRLADGWIPSMRYLPAALAKPKMEAVRASADRAGRDPGMLDYAYNVSIRVGGSPTEDPEGQVAGEPDEVIERLLELFDLGFTVLNLWVSGRRDEQMERISADVLPQVRRIAG
jgi:alkanesulfonate monooxygenase SsuD/methylene tetrahydromethanopterin reductase-like flavin-dependent oxidoreductase (luciferase family)